MGFNVSIFYCCLFFSVSICSLFLCTSCKPYILKNTVSFIQKCGCINANCTSYNTVSWCFAKMMKVNYGLKKMQKNRKTLGTGRILALWLCQLSGWRNRKREKRVDKGRREKWEKNLNRLLTRKLKDCTNLADIPGYLCVF